MSRTFRSGHTYYIITVDLVNIYNKKLIFIQISVVLHIDYLYKKMYNHTILNNKRK